MAAGHDCTGTTVWLALTLWTIMALGEAALLSQSSMSIAVWCAIFGLPSLYLQCRHILDVLVEEALQLVAASLRAGQHTLPCAVWSDTYSHFCSTCSSNSCCMP